MIFFDNTQVVHMHWCWWGSERWIKYFKCDDDRIEVVTDFDFVVQQFGYSICPFERSIRFFVYTFTYFSGCRVCWKIFILMGNGRWSKSVFVLQFIFVNKKSRRYPKSEIRYLSTPWNRPLTKSMEWSHGSSKTSAWRERMGINFKSWVLPRRFGLNKKNKKNELSQIWGFHR